MAVHIGRRKFVAGLGGAALAGPLSARAQQQPVPVIGYLHEGSAEKNVQRLAAYRKGLNAAGYVEGKNVAIEFRWAEGHPDRLPALAANLVDLKVAVIATPFSTTAALAAKAATTTIPIVFATGADPVALGLVATLNRPGGNVTGITTLNSELAAKRLSLMHALVPHASHYFALIHPGAPMAEPFIKDIETGAAKLGITVEVVRAGTPRELDAAFAGLPRQNGNVLLASTDTFYYLRRAQIAALALRHGIPAIFDSRDYVTAGGFASYGPNLLHETMRAGEYTARILKGEKAADLPVVRSEKFELVVNLKAAKALGLTVPPNALALADEVIE